MVYQSSSVSHCINMLRKVARRLFILSQLALAMYYSNNAITSWNDSPIVTSVKMTSIQNVQFPSVTVCYVMTSTNGNGRALFKQCPS